jgi:hypothetical protein
MRLIIEVQLLARLLCIRELQSSSIGTVTGYSGRFALIVLRPCKRMSWQNLKICQCSFFPHISEFIIHKPLVRRYISCVVDERRNRFNQFKFLSYIMMQRNHCRISVTALVIFFPLLGPIDLENGECKVLQKYQQTCTVEHKIPGNLKNCNRISIWTW